jgi:hypothetical protein
MPLSNDGAYLAEHNIKVDNDGRPSYNAAWFGWEVATEDEQREYWAEQEGRHDPVVGPPLVAPDPSATKQTRKHAAKLAAEHLAREGHLAHANQDEAELRAKAKQLEAKRRDQLRVYFKDMILGSDKCSRQFSVAAGQLICFAVRGMPRKERKTLKGKAAERRAASLQPTSIVAGHLASCQGKRCGCVNAGHVAWIYARMDAIMRMMWPGSKHQPRGHRGRSAFPLSTGLTGLDPIEDRAPRRPRRREDGADAGAGEADADADGGDGDDDDDDGDGGEDGRAFVDDEAEEDPSQPPPKRARPTYSHKTATGQEAINGFHGSVLAELAFEANELGLLNHVDPIFKETLFAGLFAEDGQ